MPAAISVFFLFTSIVFRYCLFFLYSTTHRIDNIPEPFRSSRDNVFPVALIHGVKEPPSLEGIQELLGEELLRLGPFGNGLWTMRATSTASEPVFDHFTAYCNALPADSPGRAAFCNCKTHSATLFCTWCLFSREEHMAAPKGYSEPQPIPRVGFKTYTTVFTDFLFQFRRLFFHKKEKENPLVRRGHATQETPYTPLTH
jgi:hypothetical protein